MKIKSTKVTKSFKISRTKGVPKGLKGQSYTTYDIARNLVRRYLRSKFNFGPHQVAMGEYGFSIARA